VLTGAAVLLALVAVGVALRWWMRRYDALGRSRPFPWISIVLLAVLSAGAAAPGVMRAREESRLQRAAGDLVGHPVRVHCQSFGGTFMDAGADLGHVFFRSDGAPEPATTIKYEQCGFLSHYLNSGKTAPSLDEVIAVHVLTHESMHLRGIRDEAQAECAAVQRDAHDAELLGASPAAALALARRYWSEIYPRMPDDYRATECRAGGTLDEHLSEPPW
jgi:hypothetical protein